jgi:hypothetical protein
MEESDVPNSGFVRNTAYFFISQNNPFSFVTVANIVPGTILLPIGLLITGWATQERVFWLVPDIVSVELRALNGSAEGYLQGIVLVGAGTIVTFYGIQAYIIDAFTLHAASGVMSASLTSALHAYTFHDHHSSCRRFFHACVGRFWIPVVCTDDVQCAGIRQG